MSAPLPFRIIPCSEWGAKPPKRPIQPAASRYDKAIFHHTAGHHPELPPVEPTETYEEARAYARAIQNLHMAPPRDWNDSGHNFLVTRSGHIFEGRHRSLELLARGRMPISAHCPGQNDQPGVEIEHDGAERMTPIQRQAAVWLFALICRQGGIEAARIRPHREFIATACPGALLASLPAFRTDVQTALKDPDVEGWRVGDPIFKGLAGVLGVRKLSRTHYALIEEVMRRTRLIDKAK